MESLDVQTVGAGGVLGALLLAALQYGLGRLGLTTPKVPANPASPSTPATPAVPAIPAVPVDLPTLASLAESLAVSLVRAQLAGGELPPGLKATARVIRRLLDEVDPPAK